MIVVDVKERNGWQVISVAGEVDVVSAPGIRAEVVNLVAQGFTDLVLDLARVDFIDSFGLGVMVGALKRVNSHGGRLRVVITEPRVIGVLELTGVDRIFDRRASVDDAVTDPDAARPDAGL
ncbi:MAG: STAS domain-containing protein [Acidimicrobiia bacterium]|nr:STAS domain-containing protein [Acidimicrobiia bacterium]